MVDAIKIDGLRDFNRNLKKLDKDLPKALRLAFNEAANVVVDDAKPRVPNRSGKAARSIKAQSTRTKARVSGGGGRAAYYPWLDFGGRVGRRKSIHRPFQKRGRYIYKSYFKARDSGEFQDVMTEALIDVGRQAGIEIED